MKTLKLTLKALQAVLLVALGVFAASCTPDEKDETISLDGALVLNNGAWGKNNASISVYDLKNKTVTEGAFKAANGFDLGDLGQDILAVGQELYIAVNGSQTIFVTDNKLVSKKAIVAEVAKIKLSPRYLCSGGGKVYVTYYEGYLGEIDPETYAVRVTKVGPNPEGVAYLDGKIYTANSGGLITNVYNNTVSVVDAATFKETSTITVGTNPALLFVSAGKLYLNTFGNYGSEGPKVQCIDPATGSVTDLKYSSPSSIAVQGNNLYVLCGGYDEMWNPLPGTVYKYDCSKGQDLGNFVKDDTVMPNAYSISATKKHVWVGCSDYKNNGDVFVFGASDGKKVDKFDCKGINPLKVIE